MFITVKSCSRSQSRSRSVLTCYGQKVPAPTGYGTLLYQFCFKINQAFATVCSKFSFSFKNSFSDIAGIALHSQETQEENIHRIFLLSLPIEEEWKEKQRQRSLRPEFALAVLPRLISKERLNSSYSSKSTEAKQLAWQGIE